MRTEVRRARPAVTAVLVMAVAAAAVVGLVVTTSPSDPARTATAAAGGDARAVSRLLDAHAAALVRRDRTAFAAGLDDAPASDGYRAAQLAAFDHADGIPWATYELRYGEQVTDTGVAAAVRDRLGPTAAIVRVQLRYAYAGVDPVPVAHVQYLTVVRRGGSWRLAADDDLAAEGGTSWHGPWEFGPLTVVRGVHCLVLGHPGSERAADVAASQTLLRAVAAEVDAGVAAVTTVWGPDWPGRVTVEIPATDAEAAELAGGAAAPPFAELAGLAVVEPVVTDVGTGPDPAAGQRLLLGAASLDADADGGSTARTAVIRHELTHVATRAVTVPGTPTWVVEGLAEYVGNLADPHPPAAVAPDLATRVAAGGPPASLPATSDFSAVDRDGSGTAGAAYGQAWFAFRTLAALGGPTAPAAFYRAVVSDVATIAVAPDDAAVVGPALDRVLGVDLATFTRDWQAAMTAALG